MAPSGPHPPLPQLTGRIAISGTFSGSEWANIFHVECTEVGTPTSADWATVVQDVLNAYQSHIMPLHSSASECLLARGVFVPVTGTELLAEKTSSTTGSESGTALPASCAAVLSWQIGAYYRGGKPRTYVPALSNNATASVTQLTSAWVTTMETAGAAFLTAVNAITTTTLTPVVLSTIAFARHNAWLETPLIFPIQSVLVRTRIDSQRRRLGKETT
jgi:hypothetical protein